MQTLIVVARVVLGLTFVVFGVDYLVPFLPEMPTSTEGRAFLEALLATGYMFPLIKSVEMLGAALLLSGRFVPFALALLAPVVTNITLYHFALDPNGRWIAAGVVTLEAFLLWAHRGAYRSLFVSEAPQTEQPPVALVHHGAQP